MGTRGPITKVNVKEALELYGTSDEKGKWTWDRLGERYGVSRQAVRSDHAQYNRGAGK